MTVVRLFLALTCMSAVAACGGAAPVTHTARDDGPGPAASTRAPQVSVANATPASNAPGDTCTVPAVYFDYDSADLAVASRDALQSAARCLKTHPGTPIRLVGATDPRGTEEYNLALGDRRARTVAQYLKELGVSDARLQVTSVGEEDARGGDERSWAMDRCVRDH